METKYSRTSCLLYKPLVCVCSNDNVCLCSDGRLSLPFLSSTTTNTFYCACVKVDVVFHRRVLLLIIIIITQLVIEYEYTTSKHNIPQSITTQSSLLIERTLSIELRNIRLTKSEAKNCSMFSNTRS